MGCNCGKKRLGTREAANQVPENRTYVDPTRALFAAARPQYEVAKQSGGKGKRFSTLAAAQDYARRTNGIIRPI